MSILAPLTIIASTGLAGKSKLPDYINEWNSRLYQPLEKSWNKISTIAIFFGLIFATLSYAKTLNPLVALIGGTVAMFSLIIAISDNTVRKVPKQISDYMLTISAIIMFAVILAPQRTIAEEALQGTIFLPRVPTDSVLTISLSGLLIAGLGLLGFLKIQSWPIAKLSINIGQIGATVAVLAPLLWIVYTSNLPAYVKEVAYFTVLPLMALSVIWFFSWVVMDKIGGADISYMFFISMILPFVMNPGVTLWAIIIAMPLQLVVHLGASIMKLGEFREVKNGFIFQSIENFKAKRGNRTAKTTRKARAVAFLPVLTVTVLAAFAFSIM